VIRWHEVCVRRLSGTNLPRWNASWRRHCGLCQPESGVSQRLVERLNAASAISARSTSCSPESPATWIRCKILFCDSKNRSGLGGQISGARRRICRIALAHERSQARARPLPATGRPPRALPSCQDCRSASARNSAATGKVAAASITSPDESALCSPWPPPTKYNDPRLETGGRVEETLSRLGFSALGQAGNYKLRSASAGSL
jgi:hypothetical protein